MELAPFQQEETKNDKNLCGTHAPILQRYVITNFKNVDGQPPIKSTFLKNKLIFDSTSILRKFQGT